jgi:hypothetical protein
MRDLEVMIVVCNFHLYGTLSVVCMHLRELHVNVYIDVYIQRHLKSVRLIIPATSLSRYIFICRL